MWTRRRHLSPGLSAVRPIDELALLSVPFRRRGLCRDQGTRWL